MLHGPEKVSHRVLANQTVTYRVFATTALRFASSSKCAHWTCQKTKPNKLLSKEELYVGPTDAVAVLKGVGRDIFRPQMLAMAGLRTVLLATAMVRFREGTDKISRQQNDSRSGSLNFKSFV